MLLDGGQAKPEEVAGLRFFSWIALLLLCGVVSRYSEGAASPDAGGRAAAGMQQAASSY
eukprot:COSAG05_NODE_2222_length_3374_cov_153.524275_3_plen_59_part_00